MIIAMDLLNYFKRKLHDGSLSIIPLGNYVQYLATHTQVILQAKCESSKHYQLEMIFVQVLIISYAMA